MQWTYTTSVISKWGTFLPFSSYTYKKFFLNSRYNSVFYCIYLCSYLRIIILFSMFFDDILKITWISDTQYNLPVISNSSFHVGDDILNFFFLHNFLSFSKCSKSQELIKQYIYELSLKLFYLKVCVKTVQ